MPGPVTWVRGIVCCMLLVFSGTFGCSFVMTPVMLLKLISPRWYNAAISRCLDSFNTFCSIVSHYVVGYRMRITADNAQHGAVTTDETALLIFNHRSEIDWLSFFEWSYFQGGAAKAIKIVLKVRSIACAGGCPNARPPDTLPGCGAPVCLRSACSCAPQAWAGACTAATSRSWHASGRTTRRR